MRFPFGTEEMLAEAVSVVPVSGEPSCISAFPQKLTLLNVVSCVQVVHNPKDVFTTYQATAGRNAN